MMLINFYAISKVDDPGVMSMKVKKYSEYLKYLASFVNFKKIVFRPVLATTKITILSCYEATAQRYNAVTRPPPPRTIEKHKSERNFVIEFLGNYWKYMEN